MQVIRDQVCTSGELAAHRRLYKPLSLVARVRQGLTTVLCQNIVSNKCCFFDLEVIV